MIDQRPIIRLSIIDALHIVEVSVDNIARTMHQGDREDVEYKYYQTKVLLSWSAKGNCSA